MLADLQLKTGQTAPARETLEGALAYARSSHLHLWEPEICRLRGEIGHLAGESADDVQRWLARALRLARKQKTPSLELRVVMSLCREDLGNDLSLARQQLAALYSACTEGHGTHDLLEARGLLDG